MVSRRSDRVTTSLSERSEPVTLRLRPGSTLEVTVVDREGKPVTGAQVAAMVSKIIAYEQSAAGDWQRAVLLVSDRDDTGLVDYAAMTERVRPIVPNNHRSLTSAAAPIRTQASSRKHG